MPAKVKPTAEWIPLNEAARILGVDPKSVYRIVDAGGIRWRDIPGLDPKYSREDVERIKKEMVRTGPLRKDKMPRFRGASVVEVTS